jgi:hypothetical protein
MKVKEGKVERWRMVSYTKAQQAKRNQKLKGRGRRRKVTI